MYDIKMLIFCNKTSFALCTSCTYCIIPVLLRNKSIFNSAVKALPFLTALTFTGQMD